MNAKKIEKITRTKNIFYYIKNKIIERIEKIDKTGYLKVFIIGSKTNIDTTTMNNYQTNGISHLFSISGMHITLISSIIMFFLKKISYNIKLNYTIIIIFLIFYLYLTNITPSILRTIIMYCLIAINKSYNLKIKTFDIILLVLVIAILINPFYIYNIGFQFSYIISFTLILINNKLKQIKPIIVKNLYISFICFLVSLPICIYNFFQINLLGIFLNIILIPVVSVVIYPLALLVFIFPILSPIFQLLIKLLESLNSAVANIEVFKIVFSKPSLFLIVIYYTAIYLFLYNKKNIYLLIIILFIHKISPSLDNATKITFLDVGQGDAIFIKLPHSQSNILIDTGGLTTYKTESWKIKKNSTSIATNKIIPYLKSLGVTHLNYLIITHGDYDHMGEAINLVNNFKVDKVIFNCGELNNLEQNLIKILIKKKIIYNNCLKELNINNNKLYFLNNKIYTNENDNSTVIYTQLNNYKFLLMGDASTNVEEDIIKKYNITNIDILKVGHHGSKTSSSIEFLKKISPNYSIISVGQNNRYGHPNSSVIENLKQSKIYRTDQDGSITFTLKNNQLEIKKFPP